MKNRCILVTATVFPNSIQTVVTNWEHRVSEYLNNLEFYTDLFPNEPIYLVENSGYNFNEDKRFDQLLQKNSISIISLPKSKYFSKGKGYQEFEMIDAVIPQLELKYNQFIKLTGRYKINNIVKLVDTPPEGIIIDQYKPIHTALTNVFYCDMKFYRKFLFGKYKLADDSIGRIIEFIVYEQLQQVPDQRKIQLFKEQLKLEGISGSYGEALDKNPIKEWVRNIERKITTLLGANKFYLKY